MKTACKNSKFGNILTVHVLCIVLYSHTYIEMQITNNKYFRETHPKHKSERRENLCKLVKPTDVTHTCQCTSHNVPKFGIPAHMHCVHCMQMNNNNFGKLQLCFTDRVKSWNGKAVLMSECRYILVVTNIPITWPPIVLDIIDAKYSVCVDLFTTAAMCNSSHACQCAPI